MITSFDCNKIENVEFFVRVKVGKTFCFNKVAVDGDVKDSLKQMLSDTLYSFGVSMNAYQVSETHSATSRYVADLLDPLFVNIKDYIDEGFTAINSDAIQQYGNLPFYKAVFHSENGTEIIAIRSASYFRSILKHKNRLIRVMDDTLRKVNDNIFKLDHDFDFLVFENRIYIKNTNSFEAIANLKEIIREEAVAKLDAIQEQMDFVDFSGLAEKAAKSSRIARLIISVAHQEGLSSLTKDKVLQLTEENNVMVDDDGIIKIVDGFEKDFLEVLDKRRYSVAFVDGQKELFRAQTRLKLM